MVLFVFIYIYKIYILWYNFDSSNLKERIEMLKALIESYFAPKSWERSGRLYELLGIRFFKKYLPTSGDWVMRHIWRSKMLEDGNTETLKQHVGFTRACEAIHLICGIVMLGLLLDSATSGHKFKFAILALVLNMVGNLYPVMLQRYNRARIHRVLDMRESRKQATQLSQPLAAV